MRIQRKILTFTLISAVFCSLDNASAEDWPDCVETGKDYFGYDYKDGLRFSKEDCAKWCMEVGPDCKRWVYSEKGTNCRLKYTVGEARDNSNPLTEQDKLELEALKAKNKATSDKKEDVKGDDAKAQGQKEVDKAGEAKAGEAKPEEAKPAEAKPEEAKPEEAKAEEAKSEEAKAEEAKAGEAKAGEVKAGEDKAGEAKAEDAKAGEAKAGEAKAGEAKAGEAKDGDAKKEDKEDLEAALRKKRIEELKTYNSGLRACQPKPKSKN